MTEGFILTAPLHEETRGKIVTFEDDYWIAYREGEEWQWGEGDTEKEAIADLLERERA